MPHRHPTSFIFAVVAASAFVACSDQSPVAPHATPDGVQYATTLAQPAEGMLYQLAVYATEIGRGAVLDAYVVDASGNPATGGLVVFQYCSVQGVPAPSEACVTGSGRWMLWGTARIPSYEDDPTNPLRGHILLTYDLAWPAGTTIGFRFLYRGAGSGIANHESNTADYTWP